MTARAVTYGRGSARWGRFARTLRTRTPARVAAPAGGRVLATMLFPDLVSSTERAARAGDRAWADVLDRHLVTARAAVALHGGETVETTGDGLVAIFPGPGDGVRCAKRLVADARELGLELRSGLHAGEVERTSERIAGIAVHLAARIMGIARAGEILVSRTVRDLVIGSELTFAHRGEHELKGIPDRWSVYALA
jgi:class 3 adenylate cyclase